MTDSSLTYIPDPTKYVEVVTKDVSSTFFYTQVYTFKYQQIFFTHYQCEVFGINFPSDFNLMLYFNFKTADEKTNYMKDFVSENLFNTFLTTLQKHIDDADKRLVTNLFVVDPLNNKPLEIYQTMCFLDTNNSVGVFFNIIDMSYLTCHKFIGSDLKTFMDSPSRTVFRNFIL